MFKKIKAFFLSDNVAIMLIFFIAYKLTGPVLFIDPDVAWHISAGELILNLKALPIKDAWSYVSTEQVWYNISWLWDVMVSLLHDVFGLYNLHTITCLLYVLLLAFLYSSLKAWSNISDDARFITASLSGMILWDLMFLRPQLISYFLILTINYLIRWYKNSNDRRGLFAIPIVMVAWANMHGGFLLGLVVIMVYLLEAMISKRPKYIKDMIVLLVFSSLGILVNPYGYKIIYAIDRTFNSEIYRYIAEWGQFTFGRLYGSSIMVLVLLSLLFATPSKANIKVDISDKILAFATLVASLCSVRYFGVFAILGAPYITQMIEAHIHNQERKLPKCFSDLKIIAYLMMLIFAIVLVKVDDGKLYSAEYVPVEEVNFIKQHYPNMRFFNNYNIGGYLIYLSEGKFKHFIDGRAGTVFTEEVIKSYIQYKYSDPNWQDLFKKYPADGAIISHNELRSYEINKFFKNWDNVYSGKYGVVFTKPSKIRR